MKTSPLALLRRAGVVTDALMRVTVATLENMFIERYEALCDLYLYSRRTLKRKTLLWMVKRKPDQFAPAIVKRISQMDEMNARLSIEEVDTLLGEVIIHEVDLGIERDLAAYKSHLGNRRLSPIALIQLMEAQLIKPDDTEREAIASASTSGMSIEFTLNPDIEDIVVSSCIEGPEGSAFLLHAFCDPVTGKILRELST